MERVEGGRDAAYGRVQAKPMMIDPKKTPTRRMPRIQRPEEQPLGKIPPQRPKRGRTTLEEVVVVDKNDPRRERD